MKIELDWTPKQVEGLGGQLKRFFGNNPVVAIRAITEFREEYPTAGVPEVFGQLSSGKSRSGNNHASGEKPHALKRGKKGAHWRSRR